MFSETDSVGLGWDESFSIVNSLRRTCGRKLEFVAVFPCPCLALFPFLSAFQVMQCNISLERASASWTWGRTLSPPSGLRCARCARPPLEGAVVFRSSRNCVLLRGVSCDCQGGTATAFPSGSPHVTHVCISAVVQRVRVCYLCVCFPGRS